MLKPQMRAGTHIDLSFWSKSRCFAFKNHRWGLVLTRLVILMLKSLFFMHKTTGEGWNPYSLFILELSTLLCVLKPTDEVWDPYRLVSLVLKSLFCMR